MKYISPGKSKYHTTTNVKDTLVERKMDFCLDESSESSGNELDDKDPEFKPDPSAKRLKTVGEETSQEPLEVECQLCQTLLYGHRFIWTVLFVPTKSSYIFSKINPLYADTGSYGQWTLFCVQVTHSHILSTPLYGHWLSAHCLFSVSHLCDNCRLYPVQIMTDFYG